MNEARVKTDKRNRILWILLVTLLVYVLWDGLITAFGIFPLLDWMKERYEIPASVYYVLSQYTTILSSIIWLYILCRVVRKNRPIWTSFTHRDPANRLRTLGLGLALGFLTNFTCITVALIHGDIKLYYEKTSGMIPILIFAFLSTFIQSASEEMWCRGFMYERIKVHYPIWVAILVNGSIFGLFHIFNDGATVLAIADIVISGISYSLLRWYTGSMWCVMGIHTMWNFTQSFLFGLPNSGLVSEVSLFHLDAANGVSNLIYDYGFGIEGAVPAVTMDLLLGLVVICLAMRDGRLGELKVSDEMNTNE